MTFRDRLLKALEQQGDTVRVHQRDLREILHHFDRLDREARAAFNEKHGHTKPRTWADRGPPEDT